MLMFGRYRWMDQGAHGGRAYDCVFDISHVFVMLSCIWIMSCIMYFCSHVFVGLRAYDMYVL